MHRVGIPGRELLRISLMIALCCAPRASRADADVRVILADLDARVAAEPANASLLARRAEVQIKAGNWQAALVDIERAERLDATAPVALPRARALLAGGHCLHAKAALDEFLASHPGDARALIERARAGARLGEAQAALADYRAALPVVLDHAEPDLILEVAAYFEKSGLATEALLALEAAMATRKGSPALVARALQIEASSGDFDSALRRVAAIIEGSSRPETWMARRASLLAQAGRFPESVSAWKNLLARLASLPDAERASHAMQMLAEQSRNAIASLRRATNP